MNDRKKYQTRWNREYGWLVKLLGKGRRRYILFGLFIHSTLSLLLMMALPMVENLVVQRAVFILFGLGLLLNVLITSLYRLRYWRDTFIFTIIALLPGITEAYVMGVSLLQKSGPQSLFLIIVGSMASTFFMIRQTKRRARSWEIARRTGFLRAYLNEKDWTFDNNILKYGTLYFDLAAAEDAFEKTERRVSRLKWIVRLEKVHYLIPGIVTFLLRSFGKGEVMLAVLLIMLGLLFLSEIFNKTMLYVKVREWEKEKGKPILLREVWEKEQ